MNNRGLLRSEIDNVRGKTNLGVRLKILDDPVGHGVPAYHVCRGMVKPDAALQSWRPQAKGKALRGIDRGFVNRTPEITEIAQDTDYFPREAFKVVRHLVPQ